LARPPFDKTAVASRLLYREELLLAVPSGHRLSHLDRPLSAEDLVNEPLIMYDPIKARYFYDLVVRLFPIINLNVVHTVSQVLTMLWLVAGGRGIAFVPASSSRLGIAGVTLLPSRSSCTCSGAARPATQRCTQFSTACATHRCDRRIAPLEKLRANKSAEGASALLADLQLPAYRNQMPVHLLMRRLSITATERRQQLPVPCNSGPGRFRTAAIAIVDG
jgi:hypothetical protein